jgi:ABC-type Mn2+/Zn2+ transport system permease subunit
METLFQILSPDFLLRNSVYTSILVGFACPLVGAFLVLRRLVFMGVALPQISSTGVAVALSAPLWFGISQAGHSTQGDHSLAFIGSTVFTLAAILLLAFLERRGRGLPEGRLGAAYVVSAALSILILSKNRYAELGWLDLLKGEVITISNFDLALTAITLALVLAALALFHKELFLVSFDRAMAITLRKNVVFWDIVLYLLIGLTVSMAVLSVGPLISFGFLLIPALAAHLFARTMRQFLLIASLIGGIASLLGFWIAYKWDFPVGPADVVLLGVFYGLAWIIAKITGPSALEKQKSQNRPANNENSL